MLLFVFKFNIKYLMKLTAKKKAPDEVKCYTNIGNAMVDPYVSRKMTDEGGKHAAYQNQNPRHEDYTHVAFVMYGPGGYSPKPLERHPHLKDYVFIGLADLKTRKIVPPTE